MGAWIEINLLAGVKVAEESHPTWVRGLKLFSVVPLLLITSVAPHVGAWIEISYEGLHGDCPESHPTWVRGLKYIMENLKKILSCRTPRGCVD